MHRHCSRPPLLIAGPRLLWIKSSLWQYILIDHPILHNDQPTSASWINAVEGFFAELTKRCLRRGVFHSLVSLQEAINPFVAEANTEPRPFHWAKDPDTIIATVRRGHQVLDHSG
jgi:hypothetical protein